MSPGVQGLTPFFHGYRRPLPSQCNVKVVISKFRKPLSLRLTHPLISAMSDVFGNRGVLSVISPLALNAGMTAATPVGHRRSSRDDFSLLRDGCVLMKLPFHTSSSPEPRLVQVVLENSLNLKTVDYIVPEAERPIASRKSISEAPALCLTVSNPKSSWWKSAVGTGKLKVLHLSNIHSVVSGHGSPVFTRFIKAGISLPSSTWCFTIMTSTRSLDFVCQSERECCTWVAGLNSMTLSGDARVDVPIKDVAFPTPIQKQGTIMPPTNRSAYTPSGKAAPATPLAAKLATNSQTSSCTPVTKRTHATHPATRTFENVANAATVMTTPVRSRPPIAPVREVHSTVKWTAAEKSKFFTSTMFPSINEDNVEDISVALDDGELDLIALLCSRWKRL
jgi:hypothetical protein